MTLPILRVLIVGADKKPGANLYIRIKTNVSTKFRAICYFTGNGYFLLKKCTEPGISTTQNFANFSRLSLNFCFDTEVNV